MVIHSGYFWVTQEPLETIKFPAYVQFSGGKPIVSTKILKMIQGGGGVVMIHKTQALGRLRCYLKIQKNAKNIPK